jgi:hypothetical protein
MSNTTTTILSSSDRLLGMSGDGNLISYVETSGDTQTLYVLDLKTNQTSMIDSASVMQGGFNDASTTGIDGGMLSANGEFILYSTGLTEGGQSNSTETQFFEKDLDSTSPSINVTPDIPTTAFPGIAVGISVKAVSDDGLTIAYSEDYTDFSDKFPDFDGVVAYDLVSGSQQQFPTQFADQSIELTPDGRYFTYQAVPNFYVVDRQSNTEVQYTEDFGRGGAVSDDGRYTVYEQWSDDGSTNLLAHDNDASPSTPDQFVSDSADGVIGNGDSEYLAFSGDGRHVVFESTATNLVPGDTDGGVFVKDLDTGAIQMIPEISGNIFISYDGSKIISQGSGGVTITQFVPPTLTIDPVTGDDYVNAAEGPIVTVSGTSNDIGSTILVSLPGGGTASGALVHADGTWSTIISIQGLDDGPTHVHAVVTDELATSLEPAVHRGPYAAHGPRHHLGGGRRHH